MEQIARTENQRADFLAEIGSSLIDCMERKITVMGVGKVDPVFAISDGAEDWRLAISQLLEGKRPETRKEKEVMERRARFYYLIMEYCFEKCSYLQRPNVCLSQKKY